MPQQRNLFAVGAEALINSLAEREMAKRDADYQAKKDARQAEIDAQNQQMRDMQMREMEAQRAERVQKAGQAQNDRAKAAMDEQEVNAMVEEYGRNPTPVLAAKIKMKGGHVPEAAKKEAVPLREHGGVLYDMTDPLHPKKILDAKPSGGGAAADKDDPTLPNGVKSWLATKVKTGFSLSEWKKYVEPVHPRADFAKAREWLKRANSGIDAPIPEDFDAPPPPPPGAGPTASPTATPPAPTMSPVAGPMSDPETTAAVAELMKRGKEVTPESIAMAKQILRGGK